jgi:iron complex outermembrane receptor protein
MKSALFRMQVSALAVLAGSVGSAASAQDAGDEAEARRRLEPIVVTAQKREQDLQDVALAVSAVTGDTLKELGLNNPTELRYVAPSVNFSPSANVRGEGFSVRGVGTVIFADSIEQSVGTVIDGVPLARSGQAVADLIDVERVEVLRGPQGMLFGKNASAGLISITTRRPEFSHSLNAGVSFATKNEIKTEVTGNVKLSDKVAVRASYASTERDGYIRNILRNEDLNNRDSKAIRAKLLFEPTSDFSLYVIGDWGESEALCCLWTARTAPPGSLFRTLNTAAGITPSPSNRQNAADRRIFQDTTTRGISAEAVYDFSSVTLTSLSAYRRWTVNDNNDPDILPVNFLNINSGNSKVDQYSQELRLSSDERAHVQWVAGLFYSRVENVGRGEQSGAFFPLLPPGVVLGTVITSDFQNESYALFGEVDVPLTDKLSVIAGARYTDESLDLLFTQGPAPNTLGQLPGRFAGVVDGSIDEQNLSGRLTLKYQFSDDIMAYALAARGYKGPGFNTLGVVSSQPEFVKPEIPTTFELGLRSTIFDGTTVVNIAAFDTKFEDFQAQSFDQFAVPARFTVTNAGELQTRGIEAEFQSMPIEGLRLSGSLAYIDAEFTDFENIACYPGQVPLPIGTPRTSPRDCILVNATQAVTTANGLRLPNSPKLTYTLSADKMHRFGSWELSGGLNWFWRDKVSFSAAGDPLMVQDAYGLLGANLRFGPADGSWRLSLFGKNLLDEDFANVVFSSPVLNSPGVSVQLPSPEAERIVGVRLDLALGVR